jgi:hypothetical protein
VLLIGNKEVSMGRLASVDADKFREFIKLLEEAVKRERIFLVMLKRMRMSLKRKRLR